MSEVGFRTLSVQVHNELERIVLAWLILGLKSVLSSLGIIITPFIIINSSVFLAFFVDLLEDFKNSGHSTSVKTILNLEEIGKHLDEELSLVIIGTDELRA